MSSLLQKREVLRWCHEPLTPRSLVDGASKKILKPFAAEEKEWANQVLGRTDLKQWTTTLGQNIVHEALEKLGRKNVRRTQGMTSSIRDKDYEPDLECDDFVYEVKARSWTTPGTAGEKILGTPLKYGEVPRLYHKPLQIVLVAYQEYEARHGWGFGDLLDSKNQTSELSESLAFFKTQHIEYVALTDILTKIDLPYGCWEK